MALSVWQQFQQTWDSRAAVAQSAGIPTSAVRATLANDYQRLLGGSTPMDNQDAYGAMQSLASHKVLTADPSGNGNIATNAFKDVQGLMTGIFHSPVTLYHDADNVYQGVRDTMQGLGTSKLKSSLNAVLNLLPGVTDAEKLASGDFGYLAQHPVWAALDLSGTGSVARDLLASTTGARAAADSAAQAATNSAIHDGFSPVTPHVTPVPDLSDTSKQVTFGNILLSKSPISQLVKRTIYNTPTLDNTFRHMLGPWGLYRNGDLVRGIHIQEQLGNQELAVKNAQIAEVQATLSPDETRLFSQLLQANRPAADIAADPTIPNSVKEAIKSYARLKEEYNQAALEAGLNVRLTNPRTGDHAIVPTNSPGAKLLRLHDTISAKYMSAVRDVVGKQKAFTDLAKKINGQAWDPPIGSQLPGLLTAEQFVGELHNVVTAKTPSEHVSGEGSRGSVRNAENRFTELFAQDGPVKSLQSALITKNPVQIKRAMSAVKRRTASKYLTQNPAIQQLRDFIDDYQTADQAVRSKKLRGAVDRSKAKAVTWAKRMQGINKTVDNRWPRIAADKYEALIDSIMQGKLEDIARGSLPSNSKQLSDVLTLLNSGNLWPTGLRPFVDGNVYEKIRQDAIATYSDLVDSGAEIHWVPKLKEGESARGVVKVMTDRPSVPRVTKARAINQTYAIEHPFLGLSKSWEELFNKKRTDKAYELAIKPKLRPEAQLENQTEQTWLALKKAGRKVPSYKEYRAHMLHSEWMTFDPKDFLHPDSRHVKPGKETYYIAKSDYQLLQHMSGSHNNNIGRTWDKSMNLFRHAVLTFSPRFSVHITIGGAFLTLLRTGPSIVKYISQAHKMITDGEFPVGLSRGTGYEGADIAREIYQPEKFHLFMGGNTLGRWWRESITERLRLDKVSGAAASWHHFLELWSDHYRVMAYLYGKHEAETKGPGLTEAELADAQKLGQSPYEYAAVKLGNKVMADMNSRSPMENTIIRFIMPFGGWTHHLLRYVMTMPIDHPLRTNFLSNLSEQSFNADQTGLPQYLFHLLFLGQPDQNGNVKVIDFRQWNPLRDVANYMTLAGWITQLNPLAQGILQQMGLNSATGSPDLYPQLSYDSFYGGYQAKTQSGSAIMNVVGSYVPEWNFFDHLFKLSSATKSLARYDPQAFKQQMWTSLNFPWMPQQINTQQILAKQETDRLNVYRSMATSALKNNDASFLNGLPGPFPYSGWFFSGKQIQDMITAANEWSKRTGQAVPAADLVQIPAATTVPTSYTPPVTIAQPGV